MDIIIYPCWDQGFIMAVKWAPGRMLRLGIQGEGNCICSIQRNLAMDLAIAWVDASCSFASVRRA